MQNRNSLTAVMLVLSGLAYNTASSSQSGSAASAAGKSAAAVRPRNLEVKDPEPQSTLEKFRNERKRKDIEYLIATVTDPIDTHLSIFFDRGVESIIRAATTAEYAFDRYWIPWRENPYNSTDKPDQLTKQQQEKRAREQEPGLLLFRRTEGPDLAVFLVEETPTSGISATQFDNAVKKIDWKGSPPGLIRVAGPSFSGSLPSLASAIERAEPASFQVVSGSTTGRDSIVKFRETVPSFKTTVHSDYDAMGAFLKLIAGECGDERVRVAVLSEGDTAFGADFRQTEAGCVELTNLPFPRDIARLRNAYRDDFLASPVPDIYNTISRDGVTLTLKSSNNGSDRVPSFAQEQTPISQDVALQTLAGALRREEIQYAAIVATDPLDTFFLARFLAANAPNIRLFQLDADLLFVRPPESLPFAGMLSITTYPLFTRNQFWTRNTDEKNRENRSVFASRYTEGVYNATLHLLDEANKYQLSEYTSPWERTAFPPLWVTASGRNGYWPIALLSVSAAGANMPEGPARTTPTQPRAEDPSHLFEILLWAHAVAAGLVLFALMQSNTSSASWVADFKVSEGAQKRAPFILVCALSATAIAGCFLGPLLKLFPVWGASPVYMAPAILALGLFAASAVIVSWRGGKGKSLRELAPMLAAWVCFSAFTVEGYRLLNSTAYHQDYFLAYRSLNIASGLSPILPLIFVLAAYAVWGWTHWQRRILIEERCQHLPALNSPISSAGEAVVGVFHTAFRQRYFWTLTPVGVAVFLVSRPHLRSLEPSLYEWIYNIALSVFFCLMVLTARQFLDGWIRVERLLDQIEIHPIRFALNDLPPDRGLAPIWQSNIRKRNHVLLSRSVDCLRALASEHRPANPELQAAVSKLEQSVQDVTVKVAAGERESAQQIQAIKDALGIARDLQAVLDQAYWNKGSSEIVGAQGDGGPDKRAKLAAEFVALRVLAYIRYAMLHLGNLLSFLTIGFMFFIMSLNSYPFQSPEIIGALTLTLFAALAALVVWVFVRMNSNAVIKRITTSKDSKRDFGFWVRLAETGALPVLAVVAANVPGAGQFLFSWIGPLLDRLH